MVYSLTITSKKRPTTTYLGREDFLTFKKSGNENFDLNWAMTYIASESCLNYYFAVQY